MDSVENRDAKWDATFRELESFASQHGRLPSQMGGPDQKRLYAWIGTQRAVFAEGKLRRKRFRRLATIPGSLEPANGTMDDRLDELEAFVTLHGRLPKKARNAEDAELRLAGFLIHQVRPAIRSGSISPSLLDRARAIPGVSEIRVVREQDGILEELTGYAESHRHLPPRSGGSSAEQKLATWMANNSRGDAGTKTPKLRTRHEAIDDLVERFPSKTLFNFERALSEVEAFVRDYGHKPASGQAGASWLAGSSKLLDEGVLHEHQASRLNAVLCAPSKVDHEWELSFQGLRAYVIAHDGRLPGSWGEGKVFSWLTIQRRQYRAGKLSAQRLAKLISIDGAIPKTGS